MTRNNRAQAGFSLIEVLVAVVIMSVGLLALASLQLNIFRSSTAAKSRSVALALAKEKVEELRAFQTLAGYSGWTDVAAASDQQTVGGVTYSRATEITRYVFDQNANGGVGAYILTADTATDAQISSANCGTATSGHACIPGKDFKRAAITVTWVDATNTTNTIGIADVFSGLSPSDSAKAAKSNTTNSPRKVKVKINDPGATAGVIPIAINTNDPNAPVSTAATNPRPDVGGSNNNQKVLETRYDVLTYSGLNGSFEAQSRVETTVIACTCHEQVTTTTGYRPTFWDGKRYKPPTLATYTAPAVWSQANDNSPTESEKCNFCCRDHHDPAGISTARFDPRRVLPTSLGGLNQPHTHYNVLPDGTRQDTVTSNGTYTEACRLIRVDGIFRTAADEYDDYFNMLKTKSMDNVAATEAFAPTDNAKTNYQNFALSYLNSRVVLNNNSNTWNTVLDESVVEGKENSTSLNDPTTAIPMASTETNATTQGRWMHTRGLYIDYLEPEAVAAIEQAKADCKGADGVSPPATNAERQACVLPFMPFTSINLTELSQWTPQSGADLIVTNKDFLCSQSVTDNDCNSIDPNSPVRGKAVAGSQPAANATPLARSDMLSSNAGVALLVYDIDANPHIMAPTPSPGVSDPPPSNTFDTQPYSITGGNGNGNGNAYLVYLDNWNFSVGVPLITPSPSATCQRVGTNGYITCNPTVVDQPVTMTLSNYNYSPANLTQSDNSSGSLTLNCTGANGPVSHTWSGGGNADNRYNYRVCKNFSVSAATPTPNSIANPAPSDGPIAETTTISFTGNIANNTNIHLTITGQADTIIKPASCTYQDVCTGPANNPCNQTQTVFTLAAPGTCP